MNHVVDMRVEGLDQLQENIQENFDNFVKELAINIDKAVDVVNITATNISSSLDQTNHYLEHLLRSFNDNLTFTEMGLSWFTRENTNTNQVNYYTNAKPIDPIQVKASNGSQVYVTDKGTFVPLDAALTFSDDLLNMATASMTSVFEQSLKNLELGPVQNTSNVMLDSLITINVDGNLDESVIPQIKEIGENLLKDRNFMNGTYNYVVTTQTKDQRKAGLR